MVGVLSGDLGTWSGTACGAGERRGWKVRRGFGEALPARGLGERWAHRALVQRTGSLGRRRWRVLHEVGVGGHVPAVSVVAGTGRSLRVVVVRGNRGLGRRRPQVGGSVVLRGPVLAGGHSSPGTPPILMERHDFRVSGALAAEAYHSAFTTCSKIYNYTGGNYL